MLWWKKKETNECKKLLYFVLDDHNYKIGKIVEVKNRKFEVTEIRKFSWLKTKNGLAPLFAIFCVERN